MDIESFLKSIDCEFLQNEPLKKHTTLKIGGNCDYFVLPENIEQIKEIYMFAKQNNIRLTVFGNGSNMLISDFGVNGIVLSTEKLKTTELKNGTNILAYAGVKLSVLCQFALENSLTGLEFLWGIPGTAGGAVFMNAGAYGGEISSVLKSCTFLNENGEIITKPAEELKLGYRTSIFKNAENKSIILFAEFNLKIGNKTQIRAQMEELMKRRKEKQPLEYPSAGSVFKRPKGYFAGTLIEECGLKGLRIGGAEVSEKHAGFIVNKENATASDVTALIEKIKKEVFLKTSVELETEVLYIERDNKWNS